LSHISSVGKVTGYTGDNLGDALKDSDVVVIPAGLPRKPGMSRDDLFNKNASIVKVLAEGCAKYCPKAQILVIANPVNSTVPIVAEVFKKAGVYDSRKVYGVTTLDVTRAKTFVAESKSVDVNSLDIPVIGGHAGITILPLLSQSNPKVSLTQAEVESLTHRIQFGGDEVVKAKDGAGSATLSMAYAGAQFTEALLAALSGNTKDLSPSQLNPCAYVASDITEATFFASKVQLGPNGIEKVLPIGTLNDYEKKKLEELLPELKASIKKGVDFVKNQ